MHLGIIAGSDKKKILAWLIFAAAAGILIWKIPYGWGAYDEPYYIAVPYRMILGDAFISDEWNVAQLSGFILLPAVWLYHRLVPSMDGAIVAFRCLYAAVQILWALVIARLLRKHGPWGIIAASMYLLFVQFNIMEFSYDSMGLVFIMMISALLVSKTGDKLKMFLCGILFAGAVLCNPYLAILYMIYAGAVIISAAMKRQCGILRTGSFMMTLCGAAVPAVMFLLFLFSRAGIGDILKALPVMLNDPTHGGITFETAIARPLRYIYEFYSPWCLVWAAVIVIILADKKRYEHGQLYFLVNTVSVILCLAGFTMTVRTNCFMLPFSVMGLTAYLLCRDKPRDVFRYMWLFGVVDALFLHLASDQNVYVISMALTVSDAASVIICTYYLREQTERIKWIKGAVILLTASQLLTEGVSLSRNTYWESTRTESLDTVIEAGPLKGVRTTADKVKTYNEMLEDISSYREIPDRMNSRIAFMTLNTWEYLYAGIPYGTFSPWLGYINDYTAGKFIEYCRMNPDNIPEYIYFSKLEEDKWSSEQIKEIADSYGYSVSESSISIKMVKK